MSADDVNAARERAELAEANKVAIQRRAAIVERTRRISGRG